jgi:hypothetical protein
MLSRKARVDESGIFLGYSLMIEPLPKTELKPAGRTVFKLAA